MKKLKLLFMIVLLFICVATVSAEEPGYAETDYHWYTQLLGGLFSVTSISGIPSEVGQGEALDLGFKIKFGQDADEHKLIPIFADDDKKVIKQYSAKIRDHDGLGYEEGSTINSLVTNMNTDDIPDFYCNQYIRIGAIHELKVNGNWIPDPLNNFYDDVDYPYSASFLYKCSEETCSAEKTGETRCNTGIVAGRDAVQVQYQAESCALTWKTYICAEDAKCDLSAEKCVSTISDPVDDGTEPEPESQPFLAEDGEVCYSAVDCVSGKCYMNVCGAEEGGTSEGGTSEGGTSVDDDTSGSSGGSTTTEEKGFWAKLWDWIKRFIGGNSV